MMNSQYVKSISAEEMANIDPGVAMVMNMLDSQPEMLRGLTTVQMIDDTFEHVDDRYDDCPKMDIGGGYALICRITQREADGQGEYSMLVNKGVAERIFDNEEQMFETAIKNSATAKLLPITGAMFGDRTVDLLEDLECDIDEEEKAYVLTANESKGSYALGLPGVQKAIADRFGCSYWVIPSSVHEVLIMPEFFGPDIVKAEDLNEMVKNANEILFDDPREILSDTVRYYDKESGELFVRM